MKHGIFYGNIILSKIKLLVLSIQYLGLQEVLINIRINIMMLLLLENWVNLSKRY